MYKIIGADQKEYGPVSAEQIRAWMVEGRVNSQTRVLAEGATEWKTLGELPEFAAAAPAPAPIMPTVPPVGAAGAEMINGPATGLMVVAILGGVLQVISLIFRLVGVSVLSNPRMPNQAWANMFAGTIGTIASLIGIAVSVLILFGAIKMKKLENYGLAMAASIIAMIPCISPCCLIGLPIGIWAAVVLSKPEVKSAFH
jgi:hypothetical protein